jgi:hypothetical protein
MPGAQSSTGHMPWYRGCAQTLQRVQLHMLYLAHCLFRPIDLTPVSFSKICARNPASDASS